MKHAWLTMTVVVWTAAAWGQAPTTQPAHRLVPEYRSTVAFELAGPRVETPATQPSRVPKAPLPLMPLRDRPVMLSEAARPQRPAPGAPDASELALAQAPQRPAVPVLPAGPRHAEPSPPDTWVPLPTLVKLRPESPVRPHEPVLDPMGSTSLKLLPIWRTSPAAAQRARIPDPFENLIPQLIEVPDDDPPAGTPALPARTTLPLETPPPAAPPTTAPTTRPS